VSPVRAFTFRYALTPMECGTFANRGDVLESSVAQVRLLVPPTSSLSVNVHRISSRSIRSIDIHGGRTRLWVTAETAVKCADHDRRLIDQATKTLENALRGEGMLD